MNRPVSSLAEQSALVVCANENNLIQLKNNYPLPNLIYNKLREIHTGHCLHILLTYYVDINGERICSVCRMLSLYGFCYVKSSTVIRIQSSNWKWVRDMYRCTLCEYFVDSTIERNTCHCRNV